MGFPSKDGSTRTQKQPQENRPAEQSVHSASSSLCERTQDAGVTGPVEDVRPQGVPLLTAGSAAAAKSCGTEPPAGPGGVCQPSCSHSAGRHPNETVTRALGCWLRTGGRGCPACPAWAPSHRHPEGSLGPPLGGPPGPWAGRLWHLPACGAVVPSAVTRSQQPANHGSSEERTPGSLCPSHCPRCFTCDFFTCTAGRRGWGRRVQEAPGAFPASLCLAMG